MQLLPCLIYPLPVVAIDYVNETLCTGVVMPPQWSNLVLATSIPHGGRNALVLDSLDVEAYPRLMGSG